MALDGLCRTCLLVLLAIVLPNLARSACRVEMLAEFPVSMDEMQPKVNATVNGLPARFTVDSGAFYSVITPGSTAEFHIKPKPAPFGMYMVGAGGNASMGIATVKTFSIGGHTFSDLLFVVGGSEAGSGSGGLLGQNFLGLFDTEYDLAGGMVRLLRPVDCAKVVFVYWSKGGAYSTMDIEPTQRGLERAIVGQVTINGVRLRAEFDTGASHSVLWRRGAKRAGIDLASIPVANSGVGGGIGRSTFREAVVPINSIKIGDEEIQNTQIMVADTQIDIDKAPDMLLGADFFLAHRVYVANSQAKLYFTYNGGPVFRLGGDRGPSVAAPPASSGPPANATPMASQPPEHDPTDADGFARRATAKTSRGDVAAAISDLSRAIELDPGEARYRFERARAHATRGAYALALADLDDGLTLDSRNVPARVRRATLRLATSDTDGATSDLDRAAADAAGPADERFELGRLYFEAKLPKQALAQYDQWLRAHPVDSKRPRALADRCEIRGLLNLDLDPALKDCAEALAANPRDIEALEGRGLVRYRRGDMTHAIADFDAALATAPERATALWERGLARRRLGQIEHGDADLAGARRLRPGLPDDLKAYGLAP